MKKKCNNFKSQHNQEQSRYFINIKYMEKYQVVGMFLFSDSDLFPQPCKAISLY